jgi:8-oxo-dGTP pyrophosphatase MutT (NUDIX family)
MTMPARILQAAAIPHRDNKICLITSSSGKRWVIPKGRLEPGKTVGEIALQEAWEEAGLVGSLQMPPVGSYLYEKCRDTYHVTVFVMEVSAVAEDWPESGLRQRRWLEAGRALTYIEDPGLRTILQTVVEREIIPLRVPSPF